MWIRLQDIKRKAKGDRRHSEHCRRWRPPWVWVANSQESETVVDLHAASSGIIRNTAPIGGVKWAADALLYSVVMDVERRRVDTRANVFAVQMSRRDGCLIEPAAMRLPAVAVEPCNSPACRDGRPPF